MTIPEPVTRRGWLLALTIVVTLGGCAGDSKNPFPPKEGHIEAKADTTGTIPEPVAVSPFFNEARPEDNAVDRTALYSIAVEEMKVKNLLATLARDAHINLDVHPDVQGTVNLNVIDQTLPQILERISKQVNVRFRQDGKTLFATPDWPYLQTYRINYLNLDRSSVSDLRLSSQISVSETNTNSSSTKGTEIVEGSRGDSTLHASNNSSNNFWKILEQNILAILEQSEDTSDKTPLTPGSAQAKDSIPGVVPRALDDTALGLLPGSSPKTITPPEQTAKTKKVIVNPQSGLLSVRATSKQHKEVQEYLDQVMNGAQRQVRIEATIVEIRLNDEFQAGVDWNAFRDVQSNRQVSRTVIHNTDATGGSTVFQDEASMFNLSLSNAAAGINTLTGTIHNVTAAVRLLHQFGDVKVLSTPKLVAMNNQVAVLKVVDNEVYFTVEKNEKSVNGEQMTTYTSKVHTVPIGLVMHVIPQISPEDDVSLIVRPTITRIVDYAQDPNPDLSKTDVVSRVPKIQVRELESMLTLHSGQVAVIGGLMTNVANQNDKDMPGFKELPVLGGLFENRTKSFSKTELVLFLRPSVLHAEGDLVRGREAEILKDPGQKP